MTVTRDGRQVVAAMEALSRDVARTGDARWCRFLVYWYDAVAGPVRCGRLSLDPHSSDELNSTANSTAVQVERAGCVPGLADLSD